MNRRNISLLVFLLFGLVMGGNVLADEVIILECGLTMPPPDPNMPPMPQTDPGFNITRSSCSETPPPVDISYRVPCAPALAELLDSGYKLREVGIVSNQQVYILISNKKSH